MEDKFDNLLWERLLNHAGHEVKIVWYGDKRDPVDVCLECEDCCEIIIDAEIYTISGRFTMSDITKI